VAAAAAAVVAAENIPDSYILAIAYDYLLDM